MEYTKSDDNHLIEYLAEHCPEERGRQGPALYKRLTDDVGISFRINDAIDYLTRRRHESGHGRNDIHNNPGCNGIGTTKLISTVRSMRFSRSEHWRRVKIPLPNPFPRTRMLLLPRANAPLSPIKRIRGSYSTSRELRLQSKEDMVIIYTRLLYSKYVRVSALYIVTRSHP